MGVFLFAPYIDAACLGEYRATACIIHSYIHRLNDGLAVLSIREALAKA